MRRSLNWPGLVAGLVVVVAPANHAHAAWPNDPQTNLPVSTAPCGQWAPKLVSDGSRGAIIAWLDGRSCSDVFQLYVQHVRGTGQVDAAFPPQGVAPISNDRIYQDQNGSLVMTPDGAYGAWLAWPDIRGGASGIYALHIIRVSGAIQYSGDIRLSSTDGSVPAIVSDGNGGAFVAWHMSDIYVQHVQSDGTVDPAWPVDGRRVSSSPAIDQNAAVTGDGAGGVIVAWQHNADNGQDIMAHHVLASGDLDPAWPAGGRMLCSAPGSHQSPAIVGDGAGGAFATWVGGAASAQHVLAGGSIGPGWPANGLPLTSSPASAQGVIVADGTGGAIVGWVGGGVHAQHVFANATIDPAWPVDGAALSTAPGFKLVPSIVTDGSGGAIVTWMDARSGGFDIYSQRVLANGAMPPGWPTDGRLVCSAAGNQDAPASAVDDAHGVLVAWQDPRNGGCPSPPFIYPTCGDIYAQRVDASGELGGDAVSVPDASWGLVLYPVNPNPVRRGALTVSFALPDAGRAAVELIDVTGRRVARREVGALGAGRHALVLGQDLHPGVYVIRLRQGRSVSFTRAVVL